jgi:hypothetical protein
MELINIYSEMSQIICLYLYTLCFIFKADFGTVYGERLGVAGFLVYII